MMHTLLEPFHYQFMVEAFIVATMIGIVCAVLSCFLILKGWSLMGDAISHAVLPGIVGAYLLGLPLSLGAFVSGLACAAGTGWIATNSRVKEDTVMGIVFTGLFALGMVMFTKVESDVHLNHILLGNLLGIHRADLIQAGVISLVTLTIVLVRRKDFVLMCFDPAHARAVGLDTSLLRYVFLSLLAATIVAALQAVGIILTVAMLVTPGCTAYLLTDRFGRMLLIASATATASALIGTYASYFLDGATGACIVLVQSSFFIAAMLFAPGRGLIATKLQLRRLLRTSAAS
ncbi:MAG: metal ABC transporter permease [Planctomycetota bacterium]|nr:metal ABC transporter permease [Planctomycetota bacterium]